MRTTLSLLFMVLSCCNAFTQVRKMVAVGSSTTEGLRATPLDSSWVSRFNYYYKVQLGVVDSTYNLGVGGNTQYSGMPTSYVHASRPAPDPATNVTKAVSLLRSLTTPANGVIIVNFPTNGYVNYSINEIMTCLQTIYDSATRTGNKCYITTSQPRTSGNYGTSIVKKKLANIKDAIISRFGVAHTLNFWDGMYNPADTTILAIYSGGDNTHFNNAGHKVLFDRVVAKNIFDLPSPNTGDYRSNVLTSGNWEIASNWQTWNGVAWVRATNPPNSSSGVITLLGGDRLNITGNATVDGNITINHSSTLSAGGNTITIKGDWMNNGGTFIPGTGTVIFSGTATGQRITGTTQFGNLTIAKTGYVKLNGTTTINGILTLTSGNITASSTYPLIFGPSATITGGNDASFVKGPCRRNIVMAGTFTYPLGDTINNQYRPATIFGTGTSDDWTVSYVGDSPAISSYSPTSKNMANIRKVSMFEFWNIAPANLSNSANLTLTYNTGSYRPPNIGNVGNLRVVHWNTANNQWDIPSGGGAFSQSGSNISGSVTVQNVNSFSPFTFGSLDEDSSLPVVWSSFTANRTEQAITLDWNTAQEWNTSLFEIARSEDGQNFNVIGSRKAAGNSRVTRYYQFTDEETSDNITYYYRLRQVDLDGKFNFSSIVAATGKSRMQWSVWPNPINGKQQFHIALKDKAINETANVDIKIISPSGALLFNDNGTLGELTITIENLLHNLNAGIYVIQLSSDAYQANIRIVLY